LNAEISADYLIVARDLEIYGGLSAAFFLMVVLGIVRRTWRRRKDP
jgi:hypothetical protein